MPVYTNALAPRPSNSLAYGPRNLMGTQMLQRPSESYLRQQFPQLYGFLGGVAGTAPDQFQGSVMDPNTAAVRQGAEYGFPVGTALGMLPAAGLTKGLPVGMGIKPINLEKGIYRPELTMEEMLKVKDIPTVERVRKSMELVGEKEFENMVNAQFKKYKPTNQDTEAMLVESVTLNILGKAQRAPYPQQAALDLAQQRAALPIEQGGLGLPAGNTAIDRAKAMGFDTPVYHATEADFMSIRPSVKGKIGPGVYTSFDPSYAERYAGGPGAQTMPLLTRGEIAPMDVRSDISDAVQAQLREENPIFDMAKYKTQLNQSTANRGYSGYDVDKERLMFSPDDIRSRFAAFDPFRRSAAIAATMGVAAPDLLAAPASIADQIDKINEIIKKKRK